MTDKLLLCALQLATNTKHFNSSASDKKNMSHETAAICSESGDLADDETNNIAGSYLPSASWQESDRTYADFPRLLLGDEKTDSVRAHIRRRIEERNDQSQLQVCPISLSPGAHDDDL